ncbi:hypothetical protein [Thermus amyloliquefaciens]|uniref:hypothetical protein n=1 Tax=Thermus amyloliquefaciens TaxID=1449080 RepID=UPI0005706DFA|nr:hypothetical protein [Thermus amyloliquefaciens]
MEPGFHLLYARRLAWRHRLLLAIPLALLGFLHPAFALASWLPLLLPPRLWERRALKEIARVSLAYPTALAYGEASLWQEARKVRAEAPPFPLGLLLLYLAILLAALSWGAWGAWTPEAPSPPWSLPIERPLTQDQEGASRPTNPDPGAKATPTPTEPGEGKSPLAPEAPRESPLQTRARGKRRARGRGGPGGKGGNPPQGEEIGPGARKEASQEGPGPEASAPGASGSPPQAGPRHPAHAPDPAPGEGLLPPGQGGEGQGLPSPWREGRPPEGVRRGVEVYLERTPLPPEARELLRRYFGGP